MSNYIRYFREAFASSIIVHPLFAFCVFIQLGARYSRFYVDEVQQLIEKSNE
ncbi:MAG: hypothetical protein ACRAVC_23345 [Trichormus sp.]